MKHGFTAAVAFVVLSSCMMNSPADGVTAVQPNDIPVPAGMTLKTRRHESHTLQIGDGYRYADLEYEGLVPVPEVAGYLTDRMQQHSYRIVSEDSSSDDQVVLVFQRGRFTSECTVSKLDHRTSLKIRVRTNL